MKSNDQQEKKQESPFERFVRAIAGVPKAEIDKLEAERPKRHKGKGKKPAA